MIKLFSAVSALIIFSIIFYLIPLKWNRQAKHIIFGTSVILFASAIFFSSIFSFPFFILTTILLIIASGILIGTRIDIRESSVEDENMDTNNFEALPAPYFSFLELRKRAEEFKDEDEDFQLEKPAKENGTGIIESSDSELLSVIETAVDSEDENKNDLHMIPSGFEEQDFTLSEIPVHSNDEEIFKEVNTLDPQELQVGEDEFDEDIEEIFRNRFSVLQELDEEDNDISIEKKDFREEDSLSAYLDRDNRQLMDVEYEDLMHYHNELKKAENV
ncbi:hypothetical protein [Falsibacillus pallidus]|uniref:Uncharacterized protein n=1 Tax=Falsibacillus pallidus TaxID=493781 RepID=A0A370GKC4_9BACI|nr:hypothetical protein [Falsibacillus pallidus]RDI44165.1 hypothetical protein DFR59_103231 [Falsibacillus pallidus]